MTTKCKKIGWMALLVFVPLMGKGQSRDTLRINLETALQVALSDNPTMQIAELEIKRVDYSKKEAWYGLIPTLNASAQAIKYALPAKMSMMGTVMDSPANYNVNANLSLSLPLIVPALWRSIQMTEFQMQMASEQARASKINLRSEVVKAYNQILLAQDSYQTLQEGYGVTKQNFEEAKHRFDLGLAAEYDCIFAEVQMQNLIPTILQIENGITLSQSFLKVLMGVDLSIPIKVEGKLTDFEYTVAALMDSRAVSLENNSDLAQLDIQAKMLQKQLQLQRSQRFPMLVGFGQYGYTGTGTNNATLYFSGMPIHVEAKNDWYSNGLIVGLQLNVPIFNGFTNRMKEKKIEVSARTLQIQRGYVEDNLQVQVSAALDHMAKAVKQMEAAKKGVNLAEKGYFISQERYNNGMATMLELRSSSQALTQAKLAYSQAIADYLSAKADYEKVTGKY